MIRHTSRRAAARTTVAAAVLLPALLSGLTTAPAAADEAKPPKPPKSMSTVGGERLGLPGTQVAPGPGAPKVPKKLTARSWIVADAESGDVLAAHNAHWPLAPASTIKMLFADMLLPKFEADTVYEVRREDLLELGTNSSAVGIKEDHPYTVHDLWNGVFVRSGNDAVHVLAAMNGGLEKTAREMNEHADALGARDTHVVSPDGYDAEGQTSSAYDLTLIARSGMQKPAFRAYAATAEADFPGDWAKEGKKKAKEDDGPREREHFAIGTTNRLLIGSHGLEPYEGLAGVKNGFTSEAGYTFTGVAQRGERTLLVTVMHPDEDEGANRVYEETADLLDWGFAAAEKVTPVGELVPPRGAQDPPGDPTPVGDEKNAEGTAAGLTASEPPASGASGVSTAVGLIAATGTVLAAAAWFVHRRWPTARD
ncbi:D-alanyl-D-alanine carboxypeptidase family protein [Streptomyces chumphonensis]|uniref:D-alanyl-D-alanine carboxypeptidase family protein n=1 Tax=Streptomyces chumphonensis TaxID=1214925 RepID=UPI003D75403B